VSGAGVRGAGVGAGMGDAGAAVLDWVPDLSDFLRRSWRMVVLGAVLTTLLGIVYLLVASASFTASSVLMIDVRATAPFQERTTVIDSQYANGIAESQVEVLQSMGVARDVVRALHLQDDTVFLANGRSIVRTMLGWLTAPFSAAAPSSADSGETAAAELLTRMTRVRRIGMSFVLELDVVTHDAALSARLNNGMVEAFINAGLAANSANTRRASGWLEQRLAALQGQAVTADRAVQDFKAQARIVDTDKGLMDEQHLGDLTTQLVLARARAADASARRDRIRQIMASGTATEEVSDALDNAVIIHLREQYVDAANQAAQWAAKVGPNHATVVQMRGKLKDLQLQIRSELDRIAEGTESDYRVALSNQRDIERQLDGLVADADRTNANLVRLHELQSAANNYKALYADFLQRYTEAVQNQSFPISDVRIVTQATTPIRQSWPLVLLVLGGAAGLGVVLGLAASLVWESLERGLRTAAQVRTALGLPCLGMLPVLKLPPLRPGLPRTRTAPVIGAPLIGGTPDQRQITAPAILRQVMLAPFSPYAETIRGLRFKLARRSEGARDVTVIGCVSALSGEGKSTVSANFAFFLAGAGFRTLLVDWDLRRQSLSQTLSPGRQAGFADVAAGGVALEAALWRDSATGLAFLPAAALRDAAGPVRGPDAMLSSFGDLLAALRQSFDYIVVDLPAMLPVVDAAVAARLVDGVVIIVEWGKTPLAVVQDSIEQSQIDPQRLLGVVLNKVDLDAFSHYPAATQTQNPIPLVPA
jgi:polysaccharide biosynthesis transport protein